MSTALLRPVLRPVVAPVVYSAPASADDAFSVLHLFANGEQGAWYDPSDLSTLYQDPAGTTPVTALGQPVGLMLDERFGLARGPELIPNTGPAFSSTTGWAANQATLSVVDGKIKVTATKTGFASLYRTLTVTPGALYLVECEVEHIDGPTQKTVSFYDQPPSSDGIFGSSYSANVFSSGILAAGVDDTLAVNVYFQPTGIGQSFYVKRLSVRELPGNHASQPTATARPVLAAGNKIDFDGVDDKLTTTFPDLGSNVTIVRSVPGTGASILTGQTIGAGARDDSTDHHGLLIINRALTAPETTLVTKWANLRAGI